MTRSEVKQLQLIITPWASGHVTVDLVVKGYQGPPAWSRRTGHLDLAISPDSLRGLTARQVLILLAEAESH